MYYERIIDQYLSEWATRATHKPVLLRGARQVGKSTAVRHLGEQFKYFVEINLEKQSDYKILFQQNLDVKRIVPQMAAMHGTPIIPGQTLLFIDEIQDCQEAIMSLRYFKEDLPELHVVAAGSLLEFVLDDIPTFGVGRIHSMYMYPMTFDEFLLANDERLLMEARNQASPASPLPTPLHDKLTSLLRTFMLVGGMPESVVKWVETHDPQLLRMTMRSAAQQATKKFMYSQVPGEYKTAEVKKALDLLIKANIIIPVTHTNSNGLPLGDGKDDGIRKMLVLDTGLMLRLLNMTMGDITELTTHILTATAADELFYWQRQAKNATAEVDYVLSSGTNILPFEVKAGVQGGMKSLWDYMRERKLSQAIRCSLENFGEFDYIDDKAGNAVRHVRIFPLYAIHVFHKLSER